MKSAEHIALLGALLDSLPIAVFCKDAKNEFRFVYWNRSAEELWGLKSSQVIGKNDYDFFPKEESDFFRRKDLEVMESNSPQQINEETITLANGEILTLRTKKVPVLGRYLLGISENITEQKKLQAKVIHSSKMASLGVLSGGVAHEINTPLAIIQGKVNQALRLLAQETFPKETLITQLEKIHNTSERIAKIVKSLHNYSRDSAHDPSTSTSLQSLITDTISLCMERYRTSGIPLRVQSIPEIKILCRPHELTQVLLNLLNNSFDAVSSLTEKWVEMSFSITPTHLFIHVTDSGDGIDDEVANKIMLPFFTTKEANQGTGLGLSISKKIVDDHFGSLTYELHNHHTRFTIKLPLQVNEK